MTRVTYHPWRIVCCLIGIGATGLGCWGAYEFQHKLEGHVSYLVLAAPVVAAMAALIPPVAESTWASSKLRSVLWWFVLIPAAGVVFLSVAERVHLTKAGAEAERQAYRNAVTRAELALKDAREASQAASAAADKTRGAKQCGPQCRATRGTAEARLLDVSKAEAALLQAEGKAKQESPLQPPVWLLPLSLDLIAFMSLWTGLQPWWTRSVVERPVRPGRVVVLQGKAVRKPRARKVANDNVVPIKAANRA